MRNTALIFLPFRDKTFCLLSCVSSSVRLSSPRASVIDRGISSSTRRTDRSLGLFASEMFALILLIVSHHDVTRYAIEDTDLIMVFSSEASTGATGMILQITDAIVPMYVAQKVVSS